MDWFLGLEEEEQEFLKRFILASGSLKQLAKYYEVSYPTVRIRVDKIIQKIKLKNYNDTGVMLYDRENQPVYAGASGPACAPLVTYGYIFDKMRKGKYKKVLLAATGALMSPTMVNHKLSIPATCHAISLEVIS